jgi:hypothetical protein
LPISLDSRLRGKDGRAGSGRERLLPGRVVNAPGPARRCAPPRSTARGARYVHGTRVIFPGEGQTPFFPPKDCAKKRCQSRSTGRIASRPPHTHRPLDTSGTAPATGARSGHGAG